MFELTVETSFSAAHFLEEHPSHCGRLHGHNWTVGVTVAGDRLNTAGMVVDFAVLKQVIQEAVAVFDHRYLNELPPFCDGVQPTAENIARQIWGTVAAKLAACAGVTVKEIKVAESPSAWVVYRP
jgi:6-pyruvoyltetrahydropterin/6-carboxytetrahydropterin synthase